MKRIGIDIGSHFLGSVFIKDGGIMAVEYREHRGDIERELQAVLCKPAYDSYDRIGVCGNLPHAGIEIIDSTLATIEGSKFLIPGCRNVFSIGGETFSLIMYDDGGDYREHRVNSPCAAGTGSFIEQQAERLHLTVSDLTERSANQTGKTPVIATRCAVFAKTDITHAMQQGYSLDAICAGLCEGIAHNVLDVLVKGRDLSSPVGVVGGVSLNRSIVDVIQDILQLTVVVPEHATVAGAVGAALLGRDTRLKTDAILKSSGSRRHVRIPLEMHLTQYPDLRLFSLYNAEGVEVFLRAEKLHLDSPCYMGIDIGSTSTKAVLLDERGDIKGGFYTRTGGEPIQAVQNLLRAIESCAGESRTVLRGVATTGSGRKLIGGIFNAEMELDEITAHAVRTPSSRGYGTAMSITPP
jgi:predicted CoA-substrate-specific enzyme activase